MRNNKKVILRSHMNMVPQKDSATGYGFCTDPIRLYIITVVDGDWVPLKARHWVQMRH